MFTERLATTPLTTDNANDYYSNVELVKDNFYDATLLSTIRAVIAPKMKNDDKISLSINMHNPSDGRLYTGLYSFASDYSDYVDVIIINGGGSDKSYELSKNAIDGSIYVADGEWSKLEKVTMFFRRVMDVSCYISPKKRAVKVLLKDIDPRKFHYFQSAIFALFPWYMGDTKELSELDKRVVESLNSKDFHAYINIMSEISKSLEIEYSAMKRALIGFESKQLEVAKNHLVDQIDSIMTIINEYESLIGEKFAQKRLLDAQLIGYATAIGQSSEKGSELFDYFVHNKNIEFVQLKHGRIRFIASGYLELIDDDMAENMINNKSSYMYGRNSKMADSDVELLMTAIFLNKELRIRSCAAYDIDMSNVEALSQYYYGENYNGFFPNPHIDNYSCMGDYKRVIRQCLTSGDIISAIEQCVASNNSLNFGDSIVMSRFMESFVSNRRGKCVQLPDGSFVDVKEAVEYLKGKSNE